MMEDLRNLRLQIEAASHHVNVLVATLSLAEERGIHLPYVKSEVQNSWLALLNARDRMSDALHELREDS